MTVRISTDPGDVAAIRAAADAEADTLYPQALEQVRAGGHLTPEQIHALRHRRARAARDLRAVADDVTASPAGRVAAVEALRDIGDAGGAERAAAFLADPSRELRIAALNRLSNCDGYVYWPTLWTVPGSREALFRLIGDADEQVALTAAALASFAQVPGADAPVLARLDAGRVTDPVRWAGALSGVAHTPEAAARAAQELFRNPPDRYWTKSLMSNLYWVRHHRDPAVRATARTAARKFCLRYLASERTEVLVGDFAWVAEPEDVPLLKEILAAERSQDIRWTVLRALARLDPAHAADCVLAHAPRRLPDHIDHGVLCIFLEHATEADADRVIPLVRPSERQLSAGKFDVFRGGVAPPSDALVRLMLRLGEAGRAELRRWADRLHGNLRTRAEWGLRGITLRPVLNALTAAGALPGDADALMAQMRDARQGRDASQAAELDEGDPSLVAKAFDGAGRGVSFDGTIVQDRDRLRLFTAERTGGLFVPECPVVEAHGDEWDSPATVRFVHGGRAFRFETTVYSLPLDVSAVMGAANAALAASGRPERFLALPPDACGPVLILTDPAKYLPVAARFHLPADTAGR